MSVNKCQNPPNIQIKLHWCKKVENKNVHTVEVWRFSAISAFHSLSFKCKLNNFIIHVRISYSVYCISCASACYNSSLMLNDANSSCNIATLQQNISSQFTLTHLVSSFRNIWISLSLSHTHTHTHTHTQIQFCRFSLNHTCWICEEPPNTKIFVCLRFCVRVNIRRATGFRGPEVCLLSAVFHWLACAQIRWVTTLIWTMTGEKKFT